MSDEYHDISQSRHFDPLLQPKRQSWLWSYSVGFIFLAGVSALLWTNYDVLLKASETSGTVSAALDEMVSRKDFTAWQEQDAQRQREAADSLSAQKAEIQRLTDQVAALSAKIDGLQAPAVSPPATPLAASRPADVPKPAVVRPPRRPVATPKPAGAISVGGAPLPREAQ